MPELTYEEEIEALIVEVFERNFEELRLESGKTISASVKQAALTQVVLYWRRLQEIAESVTDTEVHLSLPSCESPQEREYAIEGVVDIVQDDDHTVMYDIKTHDADYVRANLELYEQQLNVYAHIWQKLRGQMLDEVAVIATDFPADVEDALSANNPAHLAHALAEWEPVIPIDYDIRRVEETVREFGTVVDAIEENCFAARTAEELRGILPGTRHTRFATRICRNCDARFSCAGYREYAWKPGRGVAETQMAKYYLDAPSDVEQEQWRTAELGETVAAGDLLEDYG